MDPITQQTVIAAAGAGGGDPVYVDDVFSTYLYDATPTDQTQTINNGIDLAGEGGAVWFKVRTQSQDWGQFDTERGVTKLLRGNNSGSQLTDTAGLKSFNSNGFTIGDSAYVGNTYAQSDTTYASWTFRKAPGFFDVVTWTGNDVARQIPHSLGSVPGMIIVKATNQSADWVVYHRSEGAGKFLKLSESGWAQIAGTNYWNNTEPTSTAFTVGDHSRVNNNSYTYVAYIFAHDDASFGTNGDESIIKCGSYTGSGAKPRDIDIGFEPQFFLVKNSSTGGDDWSMIDIMRGTGTENNTCRQLKPNLSNAESGTQVGVYSSGVTLNESNSAFNASGSTYIYMAIRRPHKPPAAATEVFKAFRGTTDAYTTLYTSGFPVDLVIQKSAGGQGFGTYNFSRLAGASQFLDFAATGAEGGSRSTVMDSNTQFSGFAGLGSADGLISFYALKRAPGFMDVVAYNGTGSNKTENHNLGVTPEMMIVKRRDNSEGWQVYVNGIGPTKTLELNASAGANELSGRWNGAPTSTQINLSNGASVNSSGDAYIAYLFATLPGISKVGSYTGTAATQNIDCGFTNGARFVMIKRTDGTGNWMVFDSTRGIVSGNDPYLVLNSGAAEVTSTDYIDPYNAGFTLTSENDTNGGSDEYIFLAIA